MTRKPIMVPRLRATDFEDATPWTWIERVFRYPSVSTYSEACYAVIREMNKESIGDCRVGVHNGKRARAWNRALAPLCKPIPKTRRGK